MTTCYERGSHMNGLGRFTARGAQLLETEGLPGLIAGVGRFLKAQARRTLSWSRYDVLEYDLRGDIPVAMPPAIDGLETFILSCPDEVDALVERGYEDFRHIAGAHHRCFEHGGIAFCAYVNRELAHVGWAACSEAAKPFVDAVPYPVDFAHGQAITGGALTTRRFRRKGIHRHIVLLKHRYLKDHGYTSCRNVVRVGNVPGQRTHVPLPARRIGTGRQIRLFGSRRWSMSSLEGGR